MKSKGKLLTMVLCLILGVCCVLGFASCNKKGCKTHTYGEWEETKSATCTETGLKSRKCTVCGQTEVSAIRAIGHDWIPATCTSPKMCKNCFETEGTTIAHTYDREVANEKTLKTAATCTTKAVYYKSCVCGAISDKSTFEYGDTAAHTFDKEVVSEETLKSAATCTTKATYYKTCSVCGAVSDKDTFEVGETLAHTYDKEVVKPEALKSAATCTAKAVYYKSCVCGDIGDKDTDTFEYGEPNGHTFDKEVASEKTLKSAATCTDKAVYYKTCSVCDAVSDKDTDTFEYGKANGHTFDKEVVSEETLKSAATCTTKATYYKSCSVCGAVSDKDTDTFENGEALGHDLPDTWTKGEGNKHVKECRRDGCTYSEEGDCTGGTPTCTEKATCSVCGGKYGDTDSNNHNYEWKSNGDGTHTQVCSRDGNHKGKTENCSGGTKTCVEQATCSVCGGKYGDALGHDLPDTWTKGEDDKHVKECQREGCTYSESEDCSGGAATCTEQATCKVCGGKYGKVDSDNHDYEWKSNGNGTHTEVCTRDESHKGETASCSGGTATCVKKATCEVCGEEYGDVDKTNHKFDREDIKDEVLKTAATCTTEAVYYKSCVCGEISKDDGQTFLGDKIPHTYNKKTISEEAKISAATCTAKAKYRLSCVCGAISENENDTFEDGDTADHNFTVENTEAKGALKSPATCTEKATYYKSCSDCGKVSDKEADTFESGAELGHKYIETTTEATCTSPAVKTTTCERCDYRKEENVGSALDHDTEGVTATEELVSGCEYVMVRECNRCHESVKGETVSHHSYKATITTYPTCKATGEKTLTCETCGDTKVETVEIDTNGHKWVKGEVAEGSSTRTDTCSICNATKTVTVYDGNATGATNADDLRDTDVELKDASLSLDDGVIDKIGDTDITISAEKYTGEEAGLTPEQLEQVKDSPVYNFTINDGAIHDFGENNFVTITLPYTLTEGEDVDSIAIWYIGDNGLESIKATYNVDASGKGYVTFKTNHFSYYTVTRLTPAERCALYGHSYSVQHVEGSCTEDSYDLLVCVRCHDKKTENYKKAEGHKYTTDRKEATCTENGYELHTCTVCNYNYKTTLNATGHKWTLVESVDSTCTVNGYDKHRCDNCNEEYTENYGKAEHDCAATVVNPTCEEEGYTLYGCKSCDYNYKNNYVAALKHAYKATEWKWADDFTSAMLTLVCGNDDSHVLVLDANIGTTVVRSVCSDYIKTTYTAAVSYNGIIYNDKREKEEGSITHAFSTDWKSDGTKHWRECVCGEKTDEADHAYDDITVTKEATCVENGEKVLTCVCGKSKKTVIPATGEHKYVNGVCETCGKSEGTCDHKTLHKVTVNLADYGACGGYLYYETCECGEVKILDIANALDMDCNFAKMEEEQGEPYTDEDGNICMQVSTRCPTCGFEAAGLMKQLVNDCYERVIGLYTLSVNGEVIVENLEAEIDFMGENHKYEEVKVNLADYGACGGIMLIEKCTVCGEMRGNLYLKTELKCNVSLDKEPTPETVTDDNGVEHTVRKVVCPDCGLILMVDIWTIDESACVKHSYMAQRLIVGDTVVYEFTIDKTEENHNIETTHKMYGETCEDGVKIIEHCTTCGLTAIWYTSDHDTVDYVFDLSEVGGCKGTITGRRCEICGTVTGISDMNIGCSSQNPVSREETDENGVVHSIQEVVCSECGLKYVQEMWTVVESECVTHTYGALRIYKGNETVFECVMEQTEENHKYEYEYDKFGEACSDGYTITARCSVCGDVYITPYYGHQYDNIQIDLKEEYGGCEGFISYYYCPVCGTILNVNNVQTSCQVEWEGEDVETVIDGVTHYISTGACSVCGLKYVRETWEIAKSECVRTQYMKASIYKGEKLIIELTDDYTQTNHEFTYEYELLGETCDDGVRIKGKCSKCEETTEGRTFGHMDEEFRIDLADYDGCGGVIEGRRCRFCGVILAMYGMTANCDLKGETTDSEYTDGDGVKHAVSEMTCPTCGLRYVADAWKVVESECEAYEYTTMRIYKGEELIFEYTAQNYIDNHKYEYEYKLLGETCDDGYEVIRYCPVCGKSEKWTSKGHGMITFTLNLADYDGCEGTIRGERCVVCGKIMYLDMDNARITCQFSEDNTTTEEVTGDDKITHTITTMRCSECELVFVQDAWTIVESQCVTTRYAKITIYSGEEVLVEYTVNESEVNHNMDYSFKFSGKTCEDGIEVTEYCTVCDFRNIYTLWGHVGRERKIDLGKLGLCGGYIYERYCLACGEIMDRGVSEECRWIGLGQTENGNLYRCENCQAEKLVLETIGDKDENCNYVRTVSTVYYKDEKEVYRFERSYRETSHNYKLSFELQGESCTDGYTVTYTCQDCQDSHTENRNDHELYEKFHVDGKDTNCNRKHDFTYYECPCGLRYNYNFIDDGLVYNEESGAYSCGDGCGFSVAAITDVIENGCSAIETLDITVKYGDYEFTKTESKTYANHEFKTVEVKTVDGVVSIVSTCEKCNATRETTSMSGTPEYHDDEGYYFEYRVTPETSAEYTIFGLSDRDTYVTLYRENNGELEKIGNDDDGFGNGQFLLTTNLEAGKTYVYRIKYYGSSDNRDPIFFAFSAGRDNSVCRHEESEKFSYLPDGVTSCEDGVRVGYVCVQCGAVRSIGTITSHDTDVITYIELGNYGACRGYIEEYSCPCGKERGFDIYDVCGNYTKNKYYDDDGKLITVEARACETCGLRYEKSYYSVRNAENCTLTYYYTVLINVGTTGVYNTEYTTTETSHDYEVTYTLKNGEGSTCLDGVIVYKKCKDCGEEDSREINYHERYEERIDLTEYGSTCRGYAVFYNCACGMNGSISLDNALCEFDVKNTSIWIENTVCGWYNIDASNGRYFSEYSYIMVCAVTDPTACGLKIRYATYWLKEPNACVAYQYGTWQFGYNEQDGSYIREITFRMGGVGTCHNYKDVSEDEDHRRFECEDCGSYYYINREYGEDGKLISIESYSYNGETTESRKQNCSYSYYDDSQYVSYERNEYGKAGVVESWNERERKYEDYTGPFGDSGRKEVEKYAYSNGDSGLTEEAYVRYKGYRYTIYSYVTEGDYWCRYNYSYTFDPCQRTTSYEDSTGWSGTETSDNCHFSYTTSKYPTCTQTGENYYKCNVCGKNGESDTVEANDHAWHYVESGNYYYCTRCGLENEKGASGSIVMEDLTAKYGNGENYVVGYYARNNVQFTTYVSLVFAGEERDIMVPDIEFITIDGIRAYAFSKAKVAEWATTNGYTDYNVRFSFVPVGGDGSFDYAITFTDEPEINVITEATTIKTSFVGGEKKTYTITVTEDYVLDMKIFSEGGWNCAVTNSNGELVESGWCGLSCSLKTGETYTLTVSPGAYSENGIQYLIFNLTFSSAN